MGSAKAATHKNRIAVHVVEQHPLAARGLGTILEGFPKAAFHSQVPFPLVSGGPLVLVVDAGTLGVPLGELLRLARLDSPKASAIVLNGQSSGDYLLELLFLGVSGFVAYDRVPDELVAAINTVAQGGAWIDANTLAEFHRQKLLLAEGRHGRLLTEREMNVLGLLERGFCNKEISAALRISVSTVKFHLKNVFAKIGVHDWLRAVEWAKRSGAPKPAVGNASGG